MRYVVILNILQFTAVLALSAPSPGISLSFNGVPYNPSTGETCLEPGSMNRLAVQLATSSAVRVTRELPDGRRIVEEHTPANGRAEFLLGPLAAPPAYQYENGLVHVRGYGLSIQVLRGTQPVAHWYFRQAPPPPDPAPHPYPWWHMADVPARRLHFVAGGPATALYKVTSRSLGPLSLRLSEAVLDNQDDVQVMLRLNAGDTPASLPVHILVRSAAGRQLWTHRAELQKAAPWTTISLDVREWAPGEYKIELQPEIDGKLWPDGPSVAYRRHRVVANTVQVSPFGPWTLEADSSRPEHRITDFRRAQAQWGSSPLDPSKWKLRESAAGQVALAPQGDVEAAPVVLRPQLTGVYALFAQVDGEAGIFIQAGDNGLVRLLRPNWRNKPTFLEAKDLSGAPIRIFSNAPGEARLVALRLVPVTAASAARFYEETGHPPVPTYAVDDWLNSFGSGGPYRTTRDQIDVIACTNAELGSRGIGWSVGRSWIEYRSDLPNQRPFPCVPYEDAKKSPNYPKTDTWDYGPRIRMQQQDFDPLRVVYDTRQRCGLEIWPWLAMQRHYGLTFYGGMFACPFYAENRQWWRYAKDGIHAAGLSFYYPEVRKERVDILIETAERGADGLLVGCDRQAPMLLYDPEMVEQYRKQTGIDVRKIDASHGKVYEDWIRWRAGFFTELLRELHRRLEPIRARQNRPIPVSVRFPVAGIFLSLAEGIDVETWCREGLISRMQLDPLEDLAGNGSQDIRPYLELGRRYGVAVIGGVGGTGVLYEPPPGALPGGPVAAPAGLRRALGLLRLGVDGIDTYETNAAALSLEGRFLLPLLGNPERLEKYLRESNLDACYPLDAGNAAGGHDNHSRWDRGWSVYGYGRNAL